MNPPRSIQLRVLSDLAGAVRRSGLFIPAFILDEYFMKMAAQ
jgi:hypothetical protein